MPLGAAVFLRGMGVARMLWAVVVRGMLRIVDIANGKRQNIFSIFRDFVLLSEPREPDLESAVEHFFNFWRFCSTFGAARAGFGVGGRTFFQFLENLFYFRSRASRIWSWRQNIFSIFGDFVLLWNPRSAELDAGVDKIR